MFSTETLFYAISYLNVTQISSALRTMVEGVWMQWSVGELVANLSQFTQQWTRRLAFRLVSSLLVAQCSIEQTYPADMAHTHRDTYDFIVVGAGSAGSAVAAGLSANPQWSVLLLEAGGDPPATAEVPTLLFTLQHTEFDWMYTLEPQEFACKGMADGRCAMPRGKGLGGTSGLNGMIYQQGTPRDYDEWERRGGSGWGWDGVQKYLDGQFAVVRPEGFDARETGPMHDVVEALRRSIISGAGELGYNEIVDPVQKSRGVPGYCRTLATLREGTRNSAAKIFLSPLVNRKNLHVIRYAHVGKVLLNSANSTILGVEVLINSVWRSIYARKEVILCGGAINTPQLLLLSGIGPKAHLNELGIDVIADLPVGEYVNDHPSVVMFYEINNQFDIRKQYLNLLFDYCKSRIGGMTSLTISNLLAFINPDDPSSDAASMEILYAFYPKNADLSNILAILNYNADIRDVIIEKVLAAGILGQYITLLQPTGDGGHIRLNGTRDPLAPPIISMRYNAAAEDRHTLLAGIRHVEAVMRTAALGPEDPRPYRFALPECDVHAFATDAYWLCYMTYFTTTTWHPIGSARMGHRARDSVVDARLRVHGVRGLRVADASVMPGSISGNPNGPIIMIGQKAADLITEDWTAVTTEIT